MLVNFLVVWCWCGVLTSVSWRVALVSATAAKTIKDELTTLVETAALQQTTSSAATNNQENDETKDEPGPPVQRTFSNRLYCGRSFAVGNEL